MLIHALARRMNILPGQGFFIVYFPPSCRPAKKAA